MKDTPSAADRATALRIPDIGADTDMLTAALKYAANGFYVLPVKNGQKSPGSAVGAGWQYKSTRDPDQIAAWWAGTSRYGIALHVGRSGAVVLDVDNPERVKDCPALRDALNAHLSAGHPMQQTRPDAEPYRGHFIFRQPEGRSIGNSAGALGVGWGEVRGRNGVIVVAPSAHGGGGRYRWKHTGPVPKLPRKLAALLDDASGASDSATDAEVKAFLRAHTGDAEPTAVSRSLI